MLAGSLDDVHVKLAKARKKCLVLADNIAYLQVQWRKPPLITHAKSESAQPHPLPAFPYACRSYWPRKLRGFSRVDSRWQIGSLDLSVHYTNSRRHRPFLSSAAVTPAAFCRRRVAAATGECAQRREPPAWTGARVPARGRAGTCRARSGEQEATANGRRRIRGALGKRPGLGRAREARYESAAYAHVSLSQASHPPRRRAAPTALLRPAASGSWALSRGAFDRAR